MSSLQQNLLETPRVFLGKLCEGMPLDMTLYEERSICTIERESCEYYKLVGRVHLCNKRTYTFLPQNAG